MNEKNREWASDLTKSHFDAEKLQDEMDALTTQARAP